MIITIILDERSGSGRVIPCIVFTEQREAKAATARGVFQIAEHIEGVVEEATSALEQQSLPSGEINLAIEDVHRVAMERSEAMDQSGGRGKRCWSCPARRAS